MGNLLTFEFGITLLPICNTGICSFSALSWPVLNVVLLGRAIQIGIREVVEIMWCPLVGSLAMRIVVQSVKLYWEIPATSTGRLAYVIAAAGIGSLVYAASLFLLQRWQANPDSAAAWTGKQVTNMLNHVIGRIRFSNRQILCAKELHK